jgi:exosortase
MAAKIDFAMSWEAAKLSGADTQSTLSRARLFQRQLFQRHLGFLVFVFVTVLAFWMPLGRLINFSRTTDYGSHILFIAPVSLYLVYAKRDEFFSAVRFDVLAGSILFLAGAVLWWFAERSTEKSSLQGSSFSLVVLALVIIWMSGFVFCYGIPAFRRASFPLFFLLLVVPIPEFLVDRIIYLLQAGSAAVAYGLLRILQVPVFKEGFILQLPTLTIEVAKECSGIRSSLGLLITTLLIGEFSLRSGWRRLLFTLSTVPILIVKNGARIVTICLLSIYLDRRFLHGWLHTSGGIVFYALGLALLVPILAALRKSEAKAKSPDEPVLRSADVVTARQR